MAWVKNICIMLIALTLFAGGILFYIFVIEKWNGKDVVKTDEMNITQNISIKKSVMPSTFQGNIEIVGTNKLRELDNIDSKQKNRITQDFNSIITAIKEYSNICNGGGYSLGLKDYYDNNVRKKGYDARSQIECKISETQKNSYNDLLNKINKIIDSNEYLDIVIHPLNPIITEQENDKYIQELQYDLLSKIDNIAKEYEKRLNKTCKTSNINFDSIHYPMLKSASMSLSTQDSNIELPITKEENITSRANVVMVCN
ncbi:hypothetical protein DCO58_01015 [Helicobacter saguini]|uniref:SIMPL domain-containing protein n=1 Tax=Helicobacter saguini TaxID=1548018 RepID=A0A347VR53_9HELI|nr:hypothetical protein [Helicobacter saguini]MWV63031.1 hypothetical protein [Helicobacter saguini]MWV66300.1 hypothetical protein [Helicobacter saguini]MWV68652.1 hypothetical protein [Helicobacter saguini]MWV71797.1 hypothetical protein [Helicobacter saguini]TLD95824.1 hypothetical protein LS64_000170 [Helicobacter saguini]